jgi:hypothetical protein
MPTERACPARLVLQVTHRVRKLPKTLDPEATICSQQRTGPATRRSFTVTLQ